MRLRLAYYLVTAAAFGVGGTPAVGASLGVSGVVVDGGGAPIANAVVSLQKVPVLNLSATFPLKVVRAVGDADDSQQTTTDGQGSFAATDSRFSTRPGTHWITSASRSCFMPDWRIP